MTCAESRRTRNRTCTRANQNTNADPNFLRDVLLIILLGISSVLCQIKYICFLQTFHTGYIRIIFQVLNSLLESRVLKILINSLGRRVCFVCAISVVTCGTSLLPMSGVTSSRSTSRARSSTRVSSAARFCSPKRHTGTTELSARDWPFGSPVDQEPTQARSNLCLFVCLSFCFNFK